MFTIKIIIALNLRTPIPIPSDKHLRFTGPFRVPTYPPGLPGSLCHKELFDPSFWLQGPSPFIPRESWIQSLSPVFHSGGGSQSISNRRVTLKACWSTWIPEGVQAASNPLLFHPFPLHQGRGTHTWLAEPMPAGPTGRGPRVAASCRVSPSFTLLRNPVPAQVETWRGGEGSGGRGGIRLG